MTVDGAMMELTNSCEFVDVTTDHDVYAEFGADLTAEHSTPLWWLAQQGHTNFEQDAEIDLDQDGQSAWQEYVAGTDPLNRQSVFRIIAQGVDPGSNWITWLGGNTSLPPFQVYATTNLSAETGAWYTAGVVSRSPSGTNTWYDSPIAPGVPAFYRILAEN